MRTICQQIVDARDSKCADAQKDVKHLCEESASTAGMLKSWFVEGIEGP